MCKALGWTWRELQDTPLYVRRTFWELEQLRAEAEQRRAADADRKRGGGHA